MLAISKNNLVRAVSSQPPPLPPTTPRPPVHWFVLTALKISFPQIPIQFGFKFWLHYISTTLEDDELQVAPETVPPHMPPASFAQHFELMSLGPREPLARVKGLSLSTRSITVTVFVHLCEVSSQPALLQGEQPQLLHSIPDSPGLDTEPGVVWALIMFTVQPVRMMDCSWK